MGWASVVRVRGHGFAETHRRTWKCMSMNCHSGLGTKVEGKVLGWNLPLDASRTRLVGVDCVLNGLWC
jgi:hypothetical protein